MGIFLVISLSLLGITVYTVFLFLSVFFSADKLGQIIILATLIVSSLGFIATLILTRYFNNVFIHILYFVFALAIGLFFYLTVFAIAFQFIKLTGLKLDYLLLSRVGVIASLILFIIGLFSAAYPQVKNISVTVNGLPKEWQGKRIVQLSDVHLGGIYGAKFLATQVERVNALNPDLIVITGDLFDDTEGDAMSLEPELAKLKAREGVVFVPGNHDVGLGLNKVEPVLNAAHISILKDQAINIKGLEIIGLDIHQLVKDDNLPTINNLEPYTGQARLLLKHVPLDIAWAKNLNVGLQLSGHSHNGQMFPLSFITQFFYGKYQYGLYTEGAYNIYTSSGLGSWGPPVRTFNPAEIVVITIN